MARKIMILAGGTGGHVFPALAVANWLREQGHEVSWMGTHKGMEAKVVPAAGFKMHWLTVSGLRGKGWQAALIAPWMLGRALWQAKKHLQQQNPDVVLGLGGFVAGPGGIMARWLKIPLVIHEQNQVPGTTNRWLARVAKRILEAFPETFADQYKPCWTGNPLRSEIQKLSKQARQIHQPLHLLVLGGSQGAKILNETVPQALAGYEGQIEVWHQSGEKMQLEVAEKYRQAGLKARVEAFIDDMAKAYEWADLVICRSGAMTISELAAAGLGAILVPYPYAIDNHQSRNAEYLAWRGAARLLPQSELSPLRLRREMQELIQQPEKLLSMAQAARQMARLDATETVARICLEEASHGT